MQDRLDLGSSPPCEPCAQVSTDGYAVRARRECHAYVAQLRRAMGTEPLGARLAVVANPHDFGTYLSVICHFDRQRKAAVDYAIRCESDGPCEWDEPARRSLGLSDLNP